MKKEDLLKAVEKSGILKEMRILIDDDNFLSQIEEYIRTHKWLINQNIDYSISCRQAIFSWFENVYKPLVYAMDHCLIERAFPQKTLGELFVEVSKLHYVMTRGGFYRPYELACRSYILVNSEKKWVRWLTKMFW